MVESRHGGPHLFPFVAVYPGPNNPRAKRKSAISTSTLPFTRRIVNTRLAITHSRRIFSRLHPPINIFYSIVFIDFHLLSIAFYHQTMGKQSSFTRQNAYDALCTISSASQRNSTLEVDLRRTRRNISALASRLQEARFIIAILEDALSALLPPVPDLPAPPLPPRPDVVMDPPTSQESPEPASSSQGETREPRPERGPPTPPAPVQAPKQAPSPVTAPAETTVTTPYDGTPVYKGTDNAPTSGRNHQKPLERAHATHPFTDQTSEVGSSTSWPTSVRARTDLEGGRKPCPSAPRL